MLIYLIRYPSVSRVAPDIEEFFCRNIATRRYLAVRNPILPVMREKNEIFLLN